MGVKDCAKHGIFASKRCAVCHKPLCIQCKIKDGCCSDKCFKSRQKFGFVSTSPVRQKKHGFPWGSLFKVLLFAAACYGAARYFELI